MIFFHLKPKPGAQCSAPQRRTDEIGGFRLSCTPSNLGALPLEFLAAVAAREGPVRSLRGLLEFSFSVALEPAADAGAGRW